MEDDTENSPAEKPQNEVHGSDDGNGGTGDTKGNTTNSIKIDEGEGPVDHATGDNKVIEPPFELKDPNSNINPKNDSSVNKLQSNAGDIAFNKENSNESPTKQHASVGTDLIAPQNICDTTELNNNNTKDQTTLTEADFNRTDTVKGSKNSTTQGNEAQNAEENQENWPIEDILTLIDNIESYITQHKILSTRIGRHAWAKLKFNNHTEDDCKYVWSLLYGKLRKFRLLSEVLVDARNYIKFYQNNPGYELDLKITEKRPKKPPSPFTFYVLSEKERQTLASTDKEQFKKTCRDEWNKMSDDSKLVWIGLALLHQEQYEQEMKLYKTIHPQYEDYKAVKLSKKESNILEQATGKPIKPPSNPYLLFSQQLLKSDQIKNIPPRRRITYVASEWQACNEERKRIYKTQHAQLIEEYKKNYEEYLNTVPEDVDYAFETSYGRKRKSSERNSPLPKKRHKSMEPSDFPEAYEAFAKNYSGRQDPATIWRNLAPEMRERYYEHLMLEKVRHITFLQTLTEDLIKSRQNSLWRFST
ncbi:nucleolar transcription factor 1-like [Aethina tumida]|uniref:nucleolar transcription factor 1-like n=1 Tax=Aethina tumida TaxID=116153 RepID=UPI0021486924|nr:nucleolar transcription factor 1-like [Aethina tumida]